MTQRSIMAGLHSVVTVYSGMNVTVRGVESDRVTASASGWGGLKLENADGEIKVQIGMNGQVEVPVESDVRVYAGMNGTIEGVTGDVAITSGLNATLHACGRLTAASAGLTVKIDCESLAGSEMKIEAGRDLRLAVRMLPGVFIAVTDMGGTWEGIVGDGHYRLDLLAGGDVVLVTDQVVRGGPPDFIIGHVEKPAG
jgi:hypothetical protein